MTGRLLTAAATAALLLAGCSAHRRVAESRSAESEQALSVSHEARESIALDLSFMENMTLQHPEIIIHDTVAHRSVTIRGEQLKRERAALTQAAAEYREQAECSAATTEITAEKKRTDTGSNLLFPATWVIPAGIALLLLWRLKNAAKLTKKTE